MHNKYYAPRKPKTTNNLGRSEYYQAGYCYHQITKSFGDKLIILYSKNNINSPNICYDSTDRANRSAFERLPVLAPGCQDPQGRIEASVHQLGYKKHPP